MSRRNRLLPRTASPFPSTANRSGGGTAVHSDFRLVPSNVYSNRRRLDSGVDQRAGNPANDKPFAATAWFVGGYLLAWIAFSLAATTAQWALERAALLTPRRGAGARCTARNLLHRLLLGADGAFVCRWRDESVLDRRACVLVLLEKVIPSGRIISRAAGVIFIAGGGWLLLQHP